MIAFTCSRCGGKLKLKKQFAGRSSKCPSCKQRFVVPSLDQTQASGLENPINGPGMGSSGTEGDLTREMSVVPAVCEHILVPAHREEGTLEQAARPGHTPIGELLDRHSNQGQRYLIEGEIARGGMGAVLRAVDCDLRREVAVKYLLDRSDPKKHLRFIEEAQITGQLEHPNIVPIHELGVDQEKRLFFSMKMVKGRSLAQVLDDLRQNPTTAKEYPRGRLLNVLLNVCNGLAYAHSRGVVHRDLKPANIMVGDFGEVYVMDWGLAKVLKGRQSDPFAGSRESEADEFAPILEEGPAAEVSNTSILLAVNGNSVPSLQQSKVLTSREAAADLTQEGIVVGTPVYMPPEQAEGRLADIDERSDIYSLGAILYEVLTLQPPIENEGGYEAVLGRVIRGEIVPPEQVRPRRAGKPPRELAAVAMKALAKNPQDRYQTVESLRKDIERFQEGRSVSAKADTFQETAWKLIKRNKLVSALTTILAVGLVWASVVNWLARRDADKAQTDFQAKQQELVDRTRQAVPALVVAARQVANANNIKGAREQVELALLYEPMDADAHLLRGQLLLGQKDWSAATDELLQYLQHKEDADVRRLLELCSTGNTNDPTTQYALASILQRQNVPGTAIPLLQEVAVERKKREPLLPVYQKQVEVNWPGLRERMRLEPNAHFSLDLRDCRQVTQLEPLSGMQLNALYLGGCGQLLDLTPLKGMSLTSLDLANCGQLHDLTPLRGMPLTTLNLSSCGLVEDLTPLQGMPLTNLDLISCGLVRDLTPLKGMPLTSLNLNSCGRVKDLAPLENMKLTSLVLDSCGQVADLTPLTGMPLTTLKFNWCNQVRELTPLQGMKLKEVAFPPMRISKGLDALRQMTTLTKINGMPHDEFWKKYDAGEFK